MQNGQNCQQRVRAWCWTLNNPAEDDEEKIRRLWEGGYVTYVLFGREVSESGTPHLQGYLELPKKRTLGGLKRLIGDRPHLEPRRGTQQEAMEYCKKDGNFVEFGNPDAQGERTDLKKIVARLQAGVKLRDIAIEEPSIYCRYRNGLRDISEWISGPDREPPTCIFLGGAPGSGKSYWSYNLNPESCWSYPGDGWFDGYCGQLVAIFDDFADDLQDGANKITYSKFLQITDRYPIRVPIKGGFTWWKPRIIVLTSNRAFDELYCSFRGYNRGAVARRFKCVRWIESRVDLEDFPINFE